ncbi:MAG TPA: dihydrolipoyllysine-residue succinyltransferase [Chlamydiales bacterium]|nr:dihydrolipoyllysine-residue succinyltransferase [Chlamydiales bacterium]
MQVEIKIPAMGESIVEVSIGAILKPSGSIVKPEDEIIEIETDKVNQVLFAPAAGSIRFSVKQGDVVKVGDVIGSVETEGVAEVPPPSPSSSLPDEKPREKTPLRKEAPHAARKTIDETLQKGFEKSPEPQPQPPKAPSAPLPEKRTIGRESRQKMTKLRKVIAERLVEVKNKTALLTTFNEVDMSAVMTVREENQENFQKKHGVKLGFMSFFVKACVAALQKFPDINARIDQDEIVYHQFFNIGVAVSTERGLMVPVIREADLLSYADIEMKLKSFAEKARNGTLAVDEMQGGTFTITNGGVFGSLLSTPILNPPQSGILGMHNIVKRPMVIGNEVVIRPMMYLALSYDHRIVDGRESILFLVHIKQNLEDPARLLLDL